MSSRMAVLFLVVIFLLATTAPTNPQSTQGERSNGWRLIWSDEFDGDALDAGNWTLAENCWGGGNNERQCYTSRASNSSVRNGFLHIVAQEETFTGPATLMAGDANVALRTLPFTSAQLSSEGRGDWTYGRFEARIWLPRGQGTWPALWMLPTDRRYGDWPRSGEIDIMEAINLGAECDSCAGGTENRVTGAIHLLRAGQHAQISAATPLARSDGFHVYALEWRRGSIDWFVDGRRFLSVTAGQWREGRARNVGPFDQRFHLILNLAVGGTWPESQNEGGVGAEGFPKEMLVDWVRVYSCTAFTECRDPQ